VISDGGRGNVFARVPLPGYSAVSPWRGKKRGKKLLVRQMLRRDTT
jgi:hypothetical protein